MPDAELESTTWIKLTFIAERARREPQCQFTSLAHLLDEGFLAGCYHRLGRDRASGVDGVTWREYGEHLEENLRELVARMKAKRYKPQPAKRVYIPKDEHSKRPLGLPALEDKIVQVGIALILEAIYEADFLDCSYGFRPGRGCHQALNAVDKTVMTQPINHVIDADIKGFFDSVSHEWLLRMLQVRIKDPSFLLLIRRFLKAGYVEAGRTVATEQGTPQGGNLSPMLSNVFLHYVLDLWFEKRIKRQMRGACFLVRYADDFVCLVQSQGDAQTMLQAGEVHRRPSDQPEEVSQEVPRAARVAEGGAEPASGPGMVAGAEGQAPGPLPVLRSEREHAGDNPLLPPHPPADAEVAQPPQPTQVVFLGRVPGLPGPLPAADAADRLQPVYAVARDVRFTEEPDVGNLQVRFCEGH
jgi:retron-type reverse transcriptase